MPVSTNYDPAPLREVNVNQPHRSLSLYFNADGTLRIEITVGITNGIELSSDEVEEFLDAMAVAMSDRTRPF